MSTSSYTVLKEGRAMSLSRRSSLTYQIASNPSSELFIRLSENSSTGQFSQEWLALAQIYERLQSLGANSSICAKSLSGLFKSRGANNPAFLLAVLIDQGLVVPSPDRSNAYMLGDTQGFVSELKNLVGQESTSKAKAKTAKKSTAS